MSRDARVADERFGLLVRGVKDYAIFMLDPQGYVTSWNEGAARIKGYAADEIVGKHFSRFYPKDAIDRNWPARELEQAIAQGRFEDEGWRVRKDGTQFWANVVLTPLYDDSGELLGFAKVTRDLTERKRAEEALLQSKDELEEMVKVRTLELTRAYDDLKVSEFEREQLLSSERAARTELERAGRLKDEFLATLSHELRTPLQAVLGWARLLRSGKLGEDDKKKAIDTIERNAHLQTQIIEDLLDMSRIISGKMRLEMQHVDLIKVVEAAIDTVQPAAEAKGLRIVRTIRSASLPMLGDPNRLQQAAWNLLSNAVKFTPPRGSIEVKLTRFGSNLEVSVTDSGQGIIPEFLPYVFERFRQADAKVSRQHGGLGIGLAIVKHITELHGGTVNVRSEGEGKGATFTIILPMLAQTQAVEPMGSPATSAESKEISLKGLKVLVVDDEADGRALLTRILEEYEADVIASGSPEEALETIPKARPSVIISDIGMPGTDGYQFMRAVRSLSPDRGGLTPAVAVTAYARSEDRTRALLSGYQVHLTKPIDGRELVATVASAVGRTGMGERK